MKSYLLTAIFVFGWVSLAFCHPPDSIKVDFNDSTKITKITIYHQVKDASKHYIDDVDVTYDGNKIIQQNCKSQSDNTIQELVFKIIDVKVGDELKITADCNKMGQKTIKHTISKK